MEALGRVELPTNGLGNRCSIHLSYRAIAKNSWQRFQFIATLGLSIESGCDGSRGKLLFSNSIVRGWLLNPADRYC